MLKLSYTLLSPIYDLMVDRVSRPIRKKNLQQLELLTKEKDRVLVAGIGTGLDIPHLPDNRDYVGIDLTPSMLNIARKRASLKSISLEVGDVMNLPYQPDSFDAVVMHLILAVVPRPQTALNEAARVVKSGGHILILDKFLKPGQYAPLRRLVNPLIKNIATQTNVIFEELLSQNNLLRLVSDEPVLVNGWFRSIVLTKT